MIDKDDYSERWVLNLFYENMVVAAKLPVQTHIHLIELLTDKNLQLEVMPQD